MLQDSKMEWLIKKLLWLKQKTTRIKSGCERLILAFVKGQKPWRLSIWIKRTHFHILPSVNTCENMWKQECSNTYQLHPVASSPVRKIAVAFCLVSLFDTLLASPCHRRRKQPATGPQPAGPHPAPLRHCAASWWHRKVMKSTNPRLENMWSIVSSFYMPLCWERQTPGIVRRPLTFFWDILYEYIYIYELYVPFFVVLWSWPSNSRTQSRQCGRFPVLNSQQSPITGERSPILQGKRGKGFMSYLWVSFKPFSSFSHFTIATSRNILLLRLNLD